MSRSENELRPSRAAGDLTASRGEPFKILRLYSLEKKDPRKPGPARRALLLTLENLPPELTPLLREQVEAQLRPMQVLEIDGVAVARGSEVGAEDLEPPAELKSDLGEVYSFAHKMLWEVYERETSAIDRLSERSAEMFRRNLDMLTQLQRAIQETLEVQAGVQAILEGEKYRKDVPNAEKTKDAEDQSSANTVKEVVSGIGALKDLLAELAKVTRDLKDLKGPSGPADQTGANPGT